uniref:Actin, putative n=1 Tax=Ixodes scapularis TaxID=6945 RepID=A0A1S4M122_IXOSC
MQTQVALARALLEGLGVGGLSVTHQAICALYAYNTTSGIVVDLGDRLDIVPITDGRLHSRGPPLGRVSRGRRRSTFARSSRDRPFRNLFSDVDLYLVRYVQQQACYVAGNYAQELRRFHFDPDSVEKSVPIGRSVSVDVGRFQAPEGLFQPELWGLDSGGVHKLVQRALQECSMDIRREMARSIYLSGGLTLLPGFAERLQAELDTLTPDTVTPKVHASPYREHMAFLGASTMASTSAFDGVCVTLREWQQQGPACLAKWHL